MPEDIMAKILVVEDNDDNMKLFTTILTLKGHEVTGLPDGELLVKTIERETPALVLMDVQLPGQDGFALLETIRESHGASCRVVALTANAMAGDREKALEAGFDGYITKPIDIRVFPDQVAQALAGNAVTD